jgi:hypothetical protein
MTKSDYEVQIALAMFPLTDTSLVEEAIRNMSLKDFLLEPGVDINMEQMHAVEQLLRFYDENAPKHEGWNMVVSSNVNSLSYDHTKGALMVKFHSGTIYSYEGVTYNEYQTLLKAESVGRAMNRIKQQYPANKIN